MSEVKPNCTAVVSLPGALHCHSLLSRRRAVLASLATPTFLQEDEEEEQEEEAGGDRQQLVEEELGPEAPE